MPAPRRPQLLLGRLGDARLGELAAAGDERAFELLYDRHAGAIFGFCRHMVGSREEAEDALQQTFLRAHRALLEHGAPEDPRPWLFAIARNRCLSLLAARRSDAEVDDELADVRGLGEGVQARADLRAVVADVARLPDPQRAALVLAELADLSHAQIGEVIGVRTEQVKGLIHKARTTLIAERDARERPCAEVREELATARAGVLRRGPLRRHLRMCEPCRAYRDAVAEQRHTLALVLPAVPSAGLKAGILGAASTAGAGGAAAGGASLGGGLAAKVVASALVVGAAGGGGAALVETPDPAPRKAVAESAPAAAAQPAPALARAAPPGGGVLTPVAVTPTRRSARTERRRAARTRGRKVAEGRRERAAAPAKPGASRRDLAHARAPGQQKQAAKVPKAPGSSRSVNAPPKKVKAADPVKPAKPPKAEKPVKRVKPEPPVTPAVTTPAAEKQATAIKKIKER